MALISSGPGSSGDKSSGGKPKLWAEGRQSPGFDLRAFLRVSLANSRILAAPVLESLAGRLNRLGDKVEDGIIRIPAARLGRSGQWLPSHITTGRRLRDTAALTRIAAEAARGEALVEPLPFRGWNDAPGVAEPAAASVSAPAPVAVARGDAVAATALTPVQRPRRPPDPSPAASGSEGDHDTLGAIRNLMLMATVEPVHPVRIPKAAAVPPQPAPTGADVLPELAPAEPAPRSALFKATGKVLGSLSVGLALPVGMAQAGYAFARGDDLRLSP